MSIKLMKAVWDSRESLGLNGIETAILVKLADFAQDDGASIYPSLEHLAKKTGFSKSTTQRSLKLLCSKNLLINVSGRKTQTNLYRIDAQKVYLSASHVGEAMVTLTTAEEKTTPDPMVSVTTPIVSVTTAAEKTIPDAMVRVTIPMVRVTTSYSQSDHQSIIEPLIKPLDLLPISENSSFLEKQSVAIAPVADAPLETLLSDQGVLEEMTQPGNTDQTEASLFPPGGCVEGSSSQLQNLELLKVNSLQGFGVGCSYGVSFTKPSLGGSFSAVLDKPSKTGLISGSEEQSLVSIGKSQKTSQDNLNGPAIDMSMERRDSDSQKTSSRKKPKKENRGTRIDETMTLDKTKLDIALNQGFHGSWVASELEEFIGYYANQNLAPSKAFHVNWDAAWRNWCKNAILYDRYEKKTKPHPIVSAPSFAGVSAASSSSSLPVMHPRLQAFVTTHHQLGSNAFAFQSCEVFDQADTVILQVPSRHCLDKIDLYHRELEDHFGKGVEMVIKAPQPQVVEEKPVVTLSEIDFLEPRFKEFLEKNIQIDAGAHFAFKATTITETADTILLHNDLAYGLSKVDFYARDLEKFFGKRVEVPSKTPPSSAHPQPLQTVEIPKTENETTRKYSPNNNGQVTPRAVLKESLKDFRTPPGVNTFPYKSIGVVLQEARQGVGR